MALAEEDIAYIKRHLAEWFAEVSIAKPAMVYEIELRERLVRVEEELKHQRELSLQILDRMDKRFEQVDKRVEQLAMRIDRMMFWVFGLVATATGILLTFGRGG